MATIDEINPPYVGEDRIGVQVASGTTPTANAAVKVDLSYESADPEGVELPLEALISGPEDFFDRRIFRLIRPTAIEFEPPAAGDYLVLVREVFHNRWQGRLVVAVEGDPLTGIAPARI